jgi:hypothetical protein
MWGTAERLLFVALVVLAGCDALPQGPTPPPTVSGHVYVTATELGEPAISNVLITIEQADGSRSSAMSNDAGFYIVSGTAGTISITAAKEGFDTNRSQFELFGDIVLNFALTPSLP